MKIPELKPCPFCGEGETNFDDFKHWTGQRYVIVSVRLMHFCGNGSSQASIQFRAKTREEVVTIWNTRMEQTA